MNDAFVFLSKKKEWSNESRINLPQRRLMAMVQHTHGWVSTYTEKNSSYNLLIIIVIITGTKGNKWQE